MSKHLPKPADMSLPPEQRKRKRKQQVIGGTPPAQLSHGSGPRGRRAVRRGERWLETERRLREGAASFADEIAGLGSAGDPAA